MTDGNQRTHQGRIGVAQALVVDGLPPCTIYAAEDGTWHVLAQLASDDQAALAASAPTPDDLCRRAQHALGLAGIGSRIDRERGVVGIYAERSGRGFGEPALVLDGPAMLWAVGHALPDAIRALLQAATQAMRQSPNPSE
jgi:hypothetical protein